MMFFLFLLHFFNRNIFIQLENDEAEKRTIKNEIFTYSWSTISARGMTITSGFSLSPYLSSF